MLSPELFQTSGNMAHQLLEARDVLTDVDFLQGLKDSGHPYGLILDQIASGGSWPLILFSMSLSSDPRAGEALSYSSPTGHTTDPNIIVITPEQSFGGLSALFFLKSSLANSGQGGSSEDTDPLKLLSASSSLPGEFSSNLIEKSKKNAKIKKNNLSFGTVSLNLIRYKNNKPYEIKSPQGELVAEIQPGSPLAFLHLNRQAAEMRKMSSLERIQTMTQDLKEVFSLIDNPTSLDGLKPEQQAVLTAAKSAVIVGISHLVPIFHRITNFPTWKLDVLPKAVQEFHRFDSQAVSNQFGGKRQVKAEDIEMTVITPQMRQQLVATTL